MDLLNKLRYIRENKKISRKEVANYLSVSSSLISEIESGRTKLSIQMLIELCEFYKIDPIELLMNENENYIILKEEDLKKLDNAIDLLNKIQKQIILNKNLNTNNNSSKINNSFNNNTNSSINIGSNNNINNSFK